MFYRDNRFLIIIFFSMLLFLTGCSVFNKDDEVYKYEDDGIIAEAVQSPAGPGERSELFNRQITVFTDGQLLLATEAAPKDDEPFVEKKLSEAEIKELKEIIEKEKFQKLDEDVSSPSEDGAYYQITVHFEDGAQTVVGWNPTDEQFNALHEYIFDLIDEEVYKNWEKEMKTYLLEENQ